MNAVERICLHSLCLIYQILFIIPRYLKIDFVLDAPIIIGLIGQRMVGSLLGMYANPIFKGFHKTSQEFFCGLISKIALIVE